MSRPCRVILTATTQSGGNKPAAWEGGITYHSDESAGGVLAVLDEALRALRDQIVADIGVTQKYERKIS